MVGSRLLLHSKIPTVATQHKNFTPSLIFSGKGTRALNSPSALKVNLHYPSKVAGYSTCSTYMWEMPRKSHAVVLHQCKRLLLRILRVPFCRRYKAPLHRCLWNHIWAMSSLHAARKTLLSSVNTASGRAGWTASSSAGLWQLARLSIMFSYLLSALPHFPTSLVCIHLCVGLVSKFHAQDHTVGSAYALSRVTLTHQPHWTILKWTQSIPRQTPEVLMDLEHPKAVTSRPIHTACPVEAQERLTNKPAALQTTSTGAWIWPLSSRVLIHTYTQAKNQQSGQSSYRVWQM